MKIKMMTVKKFFLHNDIYIFLCKIYSNYNINSILSQNLKSFIVEYIKGFAMNKNLMNLKFLHFSIFCKIDFLVKMR